MDYDIDDLAGDEFDLERSAQDEGDALSLLLAENPLNEGAPVWE